MANYEHARMLKQEGPAAWNAWRAAHPEIWPDLSGANFTGDSLFEELSPSYVTRRSDVTSIITVNEAVNEARVMSVGVVYAGLNLYHADLRGAVLDGTNLRQAMTYYADLTEAHLSGATLAFARCGQARFKLRYRPSLEVVFYERPLGPIRTATRFPPHTDASDSTTSKRKRARFSTDPP
jgi:uncharacterized protein YjbI with pentapeptide repeats